jgi:hypothetical protein
VAELATFRVKVEVAEVVVELMLTDAGLRDALTPAGAVTVRPTVSVKPLIPETVIVETSELPGAMVKVFGLAVRV